MVPRLARLDRLLQRGGAVGSRGALGGGGVGVGEGDDRRRGAAARAHHARGSGTYINEGDFQRSDVEVGLYRVQLIRACWP